MPGVPGGNGKLHSQTSLDTQLWARKKMSQARGECLEMKRNHCLILVEKYRYAFLASKNSWSIAKYSPLAQAERHRGWVKMKNVSSVKISIQVTTK